MTPVFVNMETQYRGNAVIIKALIKGVIWCNLVDSSKIVDESVSYLKKGGFIVFKSQIPFNMMEIA